MWVLDIGGSFQLRDTRCCCSTGADVTASACRRNQNHGRENDSCEGFPVAPGEVGHLGRRCVQGVTGGLEMISVLAGCCSTFPFRPSSVVDPVRSQREIRSCTLALALHGCIPTSRCVPLFPQGGGLEGAESALPSIDIYFVPYYITAIRGYSPTSLPLPLFLVLPRGNTTSASLS